MPALMMHRPRHAQPVRHKSTPRRPTAWADSVSAAAAWLRPLAVAACLGGAAAAAWPAAAQADTTTDALSPNAGSFSNTLAGIGQSICPALVKPGETVASVASQLGVTKGLSPGMAGLVTRMAIQMECPGVMTSLANGKMPFPMPGPGANPLALPGAAPGVPGLFPAPGR
jgi:hypothetical protein